MSTIKYYQYCSVPLCINNINRTPDKLFIPVPHDPDRRKKWMKLARRDWKKQSIKSMIYFCEDHFDLPNDMENYMQYRIQGYIKKIRMKAGCLPSRFACQLDRKGTAPCADRNVIVKRKRQTLVEEALKEAANEEMPKCTEVKGNPGICRCCMSEGCYKDLGSEYSWMGDTEVYADMLLDCFDISITQHNEGPNGPNRLICEVCITRLRDACNFKKQVMDSEKKFIDMIGRGQFKPQVMVHQKVMKVELDDDGIDDTVEYLEEDMEFTDADDEPLKRPSPQPSASTLQLKAKRGRPRKSALTKHETKKEDKPKASKAVVKGEPRGGQKKTKQKTEQCSVFDDLNATEQHTPLSGAMSAKDKRQIMRHNVLQVLLNTTVMPFRWLKSSYRCFYCYDIFQESSELKNHQHVHLDEAVKEQAMNNYWESVVYVDISNMACKLCPEHITDLYDMIDHLIAKHEVSYNKDIGICMVAFKLDNFSLNCLACGVGFYTFGPLLHHTNKDHKGTSAILCDVCGQHFKDGNLLRLHVKTVHENTGLLCPECGEKFETKSKLRTHQKNQHEADKKKYKCLICTQMFQSHYKRSQHMASEHKNRQEIKCLHCPKTFVFRSMMMTHLRDTHLKVRNYTCGVCGWKAFNSNRLKNHMYKHSGEKNFKCDGCDKAFTTKKIMRAHFARMHKPVPQIMAYPDPYAGH